jgi:AcrR family transcriptional regulator
VTALSVGSAALRQTGGQDAPGPPDTSALLRTPRRRRVDTTRRADLLAQITDVFLAEGFTAVSVDDLARRMRCSKSTLYGVGGTKEQLVVAATKHFFGSEARRIEQAVAEQVDPQAKITTYLEGVAQAMRRNSPADGLGRRSRRPSRRSAHHRQDHGSRDPRRAVRPGVRPCPFHWPPQR